MFIPIANKICLYDNKNKNKEVFMQILTVTNEPNFKGNVFYIGKNGGKCCIKTGKNLPVGLKEF